MHMTATVPQQHVSSRHAVYIRAEVIVRAEDKLLVLREGVYNLLCVAACYNNIRKSLHGSRSVHIAYHLVSRVFLLVFLQVLRFARVSKRASCIKVWTEYNFFRRQDFACLRHEMHSTHYYNVGIRICRLACKCQRVAYEVCHFLYVSRSVIMCQYYSILFLAEFSYFVLQVYVLFDRFIYITFVNPLFIHIHIIIIFYCF